MFVNDADSVYKSALKHGAASIYEPSDKIYGIRDCGVKDTQGVTWWITQMLDKLTDEELKKRMSEFRTHPSKTLSKY